MKMEELERLAILERAKRGDHQVTSTDRNGQVTYNPPTVPTPIRRRIYDVVYGQGRALGRAEIAALLGLKQTPWLRASIETLVADGRLVRIEGTARNGFVKYLYGVA